MTWTRIADGHEVLLQWLMTTAAFCSDDMNAAQGVHLFMTAVLLRTIEIQPRLLLCVRVGRTHSILMLFLICLRWVLGCL